MEFLAMLYTVLLVAICLMMAVLLFRSGRPTGGLDEADCEELKDWLEEQLAAQAREFNARQDAIAQQNYAAIRSVSETLQTAVQSMSTTLGQGQDSQQRILERSLQSLEQANNQQMEQLRRAMVESMTALQAENTRKLDEIRHTVDEQLQDALQKRVTESFKAVNQQLEQVYKGLGEMQSLAADVGGLKQVLSGVKTRGILGEIQLGAILEEILAPEQYDTNVATIPGSTQRVEYAIRMPGADGGSVWLPIDSKFPGDTYAHLQDAQASGDAQAVENARHALELVLRAEAKDIRMAYSTRWVLPGMVATLVSYCSGARISSRMAPSWISPKMPRVLTPDSTCFRPPTSAARLCISPRPLYTCSSWALTALKLSVTRFCRASCSCSSTVQRISSSFWAFCACKAAMLSASVLRISSSLRALEASSPCRRCSMVCCCAACPAFRVLLIPCTAVCSVSLMPRMAS